MTKKHVLVIDDDKSITTLTKRTLEASGEFEVSVENESCKALHAARQAKPDLILLDVIMPGLDGGDVRRQLRNDWMLSSIPVIFFTGLVSHQDVSRDAVVESGGDIMLPKPVNVEIIKRCMDGRLAAAA